MTDDTLHLKVNGINFEGWTAVRVSRGVERMPSDFEIEMTERTPEVSKGVIARPGDPCSIYLGTDKVVTGYIDRYRPSVDAESHSVVVQGRSRCQDLVDCAALVEGMSISSTSVLDITKQLIAPFAGPITVSSLSGDGDSNLFTTNVNLGESPWDIIEVLARFEGLLAYDDTDGNVVLSRVGTTRMSSGFREGVNVEKCIATFSMDQRFDRYIAAIQSVAKFTDIGNGGNILTTVYDKSVPRYRPRLIVSEQQQNGTPLAETRANWEMARRRGRSQAVQMVCDSWRDDKGKLWQPNALAPVHVPSCKIVDQTWCISEVTYSRNEDSGTTALLVLMPPEAFTPEPAELQAYALQLAQAVKDDAPRTPADQATRDATPGSTPRGAQ